MTSAKPLILAVDDEADMRETLRSVLKKDYQVLTASSGQEALKLLPGEPVALVLLDIRMKDLDGLAVLKQIKELDPGLEVIMVSASRDISSAVEAMKKGAFDYVSKPFDKEELRALVAKALERRALVRENQYLKGSLEEATSYCDLIGRSPAMKQLFKMIAGVAPTASTVLIHGESGTGKELVARAIHKQSKRSAQPFIAVNCAAIPDNLLESELFGHERGSFTGALERKLGKFELADGGTLFLDEIGCMPAAMQAKLLRVLEDRTIERLGGEKGIPVDVRIISATNIDFEREISEGKFRQDLYYRLNVIPLPLSPLRERREDIPLLIDYFLNKFNKQLNRQVKGFSPEAHLLLQAHDWPGNVRELQNLIERIVVLAQAELVTPAELPPLARGIKLVAASAARCSVARTLKENVEDFERQLINGALARHGHNISQAAQELKLARTSLLVRMRVLGLSAGS